MLIITLVLLIILTVMIFLWFKTLQYYDSGKHILITGICILLIIFSCFFLADIYYPFYYNMKHGTIHKQLIKSIIKNLESYKDHSDLLNHLRELDEKYIVTYENQNDRYEAVIEEFIANSETSKGAKSSLP